MNGIFKYHLINVTEHFLEHKGGCVKSCPAGYQPKDSKCQECTDSCPKCM